MGLFAEALRGVISSGNCEAASASEEFRNNTRLCILYSVLHAARYACVSLSVTDGRFGFATQFRAAAICKVNMRKTARVSLESI